MKDATGTSDTRKKGGGAELEKILEEICLNPTVSSLAERLMRGILVERGEDGRLRAEGMTDYSEHLRIEQDPDGTWRVTDGAGEMFHGLPDEPTAWLIANYAYATATKPMKGETPEETKARIDSTISIKRKMRHDLH
jgi:hypothetical protein